MKLLTLIVFVIFMITGCSKPEQQVVIYKTNSNVVKNTDNKKETVSVLTQESIIEAPQNFTNGEEKEKLALVYGINNIGKYSIEAINVIGTYLSKQYKNYSLKVFDISNESNESYDSVLDEMNELGINNAVFLITENNVESLIQNEKNKDINIYLPIINAKKYLNEMVVGENIIFGGIDYDAQFDFIISEIEKTRAIDINRSLEMNETMALENPINTSVYEIHDQKTISKKLFKSFVEKIDNYKSINMYGKNPNYSEVLSRYKDLNQSTVVLNTSIVKSSIILSKLRANEIYPKAVYSTQLNYTPLIFVLTQADDRNIVKMTNAIQNLPYEIEAIFNLIGTDVRYNWVNYSTLIGIEYLFSKSNVVFGNEINKNQVQYKISLIDVNNHSFYVNKE